MKSKVVNLLCTWAIWLLSLATALDERHAVAAIEAMHEGRNDLVVT